MRVFFTLLALLCSLNRKNVEAFYSISKSKNVFHLRQIQPGRVCPFSSAKETDIKKPIEFMKLAEEKQARVVQMSLRHLELNQSMALRHLEFNQSMALRHLEFNQSMALKLLELNETNRRHRCQLFFSLYVVVVSVFGCLQCAIYIRDGLLGKKSGEIAFYTSMSILVNQMSKMIKAIWDLGFLKSFYKFLKEIYTSIFK
jgi:hypothetical protein